MKYFCITLVILLSVTLLSFGVSEPLIRVLISDSATSVTLTATTNGKLIDADVNKIIIYTKPYDTVTVVAKNDKLHIKGYTRLSSKMIFTPIEGKLYFNKRHYRGYFKIVSNKGKIQLINVIKMEEYLYGVLKNEVNLSWNMEMQKVQAVAARTYAYYTLRKVREKDRSSEYDLRADNLSQVYGGMESEADVVIEAVNATRGEIITYKGKPIEAVYHSESGGITASAKEVWGRDIPYLKVVYSPFEREAPHYHWRYFLSYDEIGHILRTMDYNIWRVNKVKVVSRTESGRIGKMRVYSRFGYHYDVEGKDFRLKVGPKKLLSTLCVLESSEKGVTFVGKGFGHGVGLPQWGAKGYTERGYDYKFVLQHFYAGTKIEKMY
ncbi:MAG: hypothetical protein DRP50_02950 [Thermotoga sp.]|nr:MAG: hypothetical protein DRP50_02950 [Thermotoga sp.]